MLVNKVINLTMNGAIQQLTTTGIFTPKFVIKNPIGNDPVEIGHTNDSNTLPVALTAANSLYTLDGGESVTIGEDNRSYWVGENYLLNHWVAKGTNTQVLKITYVARRDNGTPA